MTSLRDLPNLGGVVITQLARVGITTPAQLKRAGSVGAAVKLAHAGVDVCSSKLSALEGAIRGVRWHSIPAEERAELRKRLDARMRR